MSQQKKANHPNIKVDSLLTSVQQAMKEDEEDSLHRRVRLNRSHTDNISGAGPDKNLPANQRDSTAAPGAHFSEKIYMLPESFNALRRELEENWNDWFTAVQPQFRISPAFAMAFEAATFVGMCNGKMDLVIQFDSQNVDGICKEILNAFRAARGVSAIH